jgi:hypothetical protein
LWALLGSRKVIRNNITLRISGPAREVAASLASKSVLNKELLFSALVFSEDGKGGIRSSSYTVGGINSHLFEEKSEA